MRRRIVGGLALPCFFAVGLLFSPAAEAEPASVECYDGQWTESGPPGDQRFRFRLRLITRRGSQVSGEFTWRQDHVSWNPQGNGSVGQEFVLGTREGDRITLRGTRVSTRDLALDRYRIRVMPDGRITGQSATLENDWTSRITGRRVSCEPARRRPTGRLPLPG